MIYYYHQPTKESVYLTTAPNKREAKYQFMEKVSDIISVDQIQDVELIIIQENEKENHQKKWNTHLKNNFKPQMNLGRKNIIQK